MSRFKIVLTALALLVAAGVTLRALSGSAARADTMTLYLGGYSKDANGGLCAAQFDAATGTLSEARVVAPLANPSWIALAPNKATLYALSEGKTGGVSAYAVGENGTLKPLNSQPMGGGLAHLGVDATGQWLLAAAYGAGNVGLFPLGADGSIGAQKQLLQLEGSGPNERRQKSAHAHQALFSPDNKRALIVDLGSDKVWNFSFDEKSGALEAADPPFLATKPGAGPRHLAFGGAKIYVINELDNTLTVFDQGEAVQTISALAPDFQGQSSAAEVITSADGRVLYASNRGAKDAPSSIAAFRIGEDGHLSPLGWAETGTQPRHFALSPSGQWLLAANQQERAVTVYRVEAQTGALSFHSKLENVPVEPTCLVWVK